MKTELKILRDSHARHFRPKKQTGSSGRCVHFPMWLCRVSSHSELAFWLNSRGAHCGALSEWMEWWVIGSSTFNRFFFYFYSRRLREAALFAFNLRRSLTQVFLTWPFPRGFDTTRLANNHSVMSIHGKVLVMASNNSSVMGARLVGACTCLSTSHFF